MNKRLSVIIPSYNRDCLLINNINDIIKNFKILNFHDYEIIVVYNGPISNKTEIFSIFSSNEKVKFYWSENQLFPGIARNIGINNCNSEWIWFVDDDDEILFDNLKETLNIIKNNDSNIDVIAHSLKFTYDNIENLIRKILLFNEKQEVFRFIFRKKILDENNIVFSDGLHEDIRYVVELLLCAKNIKILNYTIYNKITKDDSITKKLNTLRIDGYINAAKEILKIDHQLIQNHKNEFVTQILGTILYLIDKSPFDDKVKFINHLDNVFSLELKNNIIEKYNKKNTNFKYAVSLYLNKNNIEKFISDLQYCFQTYLSCKDLKNSIFLGPQEIIGCCKRFFYKGKMKGDIVLIKDSSDITLNSILDRKKEIENLINSDLYEDCEGCPYIERYEKSKEEKVSYISLENFNYCNMKCSYCSPKYYGGRESSYNADKIISELIDGNYLDQKVHVVWGGGEPTLSLKFKDITEKLLTCDQVSKIRVLTNSLKFSNDLYNVIQNDKIRVVTSIDAGTQPQFQKIRGKGNLIQVLENLQKYNSQIKNSENLTLKYITTNDNSNTDEIKEFVYLMKKYKFEKNFIQISCNFLFEKLEEHIIFSIYELAGRLLNEGFEFIYFDDLIRDRLNLNDEMADKVINYLVNNKIYHENIMHYKCDKNVILWGDGFQSKWIKNNTTFGKTNKIIKTITNKNELNQITFGNNTVLCPSAVQYLPEIYKDIKKTELSKDKVKFGIFL